MAASTRNDPAEGDEHRRKVLAATDEVLVEWRDVLDRLGRGDDEQVAGPRD